MARKKDIVHAVMIVSTGTLPFVLFAVLMLSVFERQQEELVVGEIGRRAETAALLSQQKVMGELDTLQALATSRGIDEGNLEHLLAESRRLLESRPQWLMVVLTDGQRQLVSISQEVAARPPPHQNSESVREAFATGAPQVAPRRDGLVGLYVPAIRNGAVRLVIGAVVDPEWIMKDIRNIILPPGWTAELIDREQTILGRADGGEAAKLNDQLRSPEVLQAGNVLPVMTTDGSSALGTLAPVENLGWQVCVLAPAETVGRDSWPLRVAVWGGAAVAALLTILLSVAILLVWAGRRQNDALRHAYARLRLKRAFLNTLIRQAPVGIKITDKASGRTIAINSKGRELLGKSKRGRGMQEAGANMARRADGSPYDREEFPTARALNRDQVTEGEDVILFRHDGKRLRIQVSSAPIHDGAGQTVAAITVFTSIEEYRRAQEALQEREHELKISDERLRLAARVGGFGIFDWDIATDRHFWSPETYEIMGWRGDEPVTVQGLIDTIHPDDRERYRQTVRRGFAGTGLWTAEYRILRKTDQQVRWLSVSVQTSFTEVDGSRRPLRVIGACHDVTERKLAECRLRDLQTELSHASRLTEMGQMSAALAHELNQPLTSVISYIGGCRIILKDDLLTLPQVEHLRMALAAARKEALRVGGIIRRLRSFIERNDTEREVEDAAQVIEDALPLALLGSQEQGITCELDTGRAGTIFVDKIQIQQVLVNLIRNAVEAMKDSPRRELTVGAQIVADDVEFYVADTGVGIPPELEGRLFEPFASTKIDGMGIGLTVCRAIVEAHGGRIWAEARAGGGTVFSFTVPRFITEETENVD